MVVGHRSGPGHNFPLPARTATRRPRRAEVLLGASSEHFCPCISGWLCYTGRTRPCRVAGTNLRECSSTLSWAGRSPCSNVARAPARFGCAKGKFPSQAKPSPHDSGIRPELRNGEWRCAGLRVPVGRLQMELPGPGGRDGVTPRSARARQGLADSGSPLCPRGWFGAARPDVSIRGRGMLHSGVAGS